MDWFKQNIAEADVVYTSQVWLAGPLYGFKGSRQSQCDVKFNLIKNIQALRLQVRQYTFHQYVQKRFITINHVVHIMIMKVENGQRRKRICCPWRW